MPEPHRPCPAEFRRRVVGLVRAGHSPEGHEVLRVEDSGPQEMNGDAHFKPRAART